MKIYWLFYLLFAFIMVNCGYNKSDMDKKYSEGINAGYNQGYQKGKLDGYTEGKSEGYDVGYIDGKKKGENEGFIAGSADGYKKGHIAGLKEGLKNADEVLYNKGQSEGYEKGYEAAINSETSEKSYIELMVQQFDRNFVETFSLICFIINCIALFIGIIILLFGNYNDGISILGKSFSIMFGLLIAIVLINQSILYNLLSVNFGKTWRIVLFILISISVFGISYFLRNLLEKYGNLYTYYFIIGFMTLILSFFVYFIFNIKLFLLDNQFISDLMISISIGGLLFGMNTVVRITKRKSVLKNDL